MPILTFRVSVPLNTPATLPLTHSLLSGASAIQSIMIWSASANLAMEKSGYRLLNHQGTTIIPDIGSHDNFAFGASEDGWAPIPPTPQKLDLNHQVIEGPPYQLFFQFYNTDAAAILVGGYIVVVEPMAKLAQDAMIYEFLTSRPATAEEVSPKTKTALESKPEKPLDISSIIKKPDFEVRKK